MVCPETLMEKKKSVLKLPLKRKCIVVDSTRRANGSPKRHKKKAPTHDDVAAGEISGEIWRSPFPLLYVASLARTPLRRLFFFL